MSVLPAILFLLVATGISLRPRCDAEAALSRGHTQAVKGIFVVSVFGSHFCSYATSAQWFDKPLLWYCHWLGQLMVVPFLFYSGYGIFEAAREKGAAYLGPFPRKRILKTLLHFDAAVVLFVVFSAFFDPARLSLRKALAALVAWDSVGNSNWFVFAILCAWLFCWTGLVLFKGDRFRALLATTALCMCYIAVVSRVKEHWWWDTILAFPLGCAVSLWKEKLVPLQKALPWSACCGFAWISWEAARRGWIPDVHGQIPLVAFAALTVLLSMRFALAGKPLSWLGANVFGIYILQRLPMEFGKHFHWNETHVHLYFFFCLAATLALAAVFGRAMRLVDSKWFKS